MLSFFVPSVYAVLVRFNDNPSIAEQDLLGTDLQFIALLPFLGVICFQLEN